MNNKNGYSVDGFVSRRAPINHGSRLGVSNAASQGFVGPRGMDVTASPGARRVGLPPVQPVSKRPQSAARGAPAKAIKSVATSTGLSRADIDSSLRDIDTDPSTGGKDNKGKKKRNYLKIAKRMLTFLLIIGVVIGLYIGVTALMAGGKMFSGSFMDLVRKAPLQTDSNGRSNILVFGTSEDGEGGNHPGGELSDSIMLVSIDQEKKDAAMVSVPRDLWVELDNPCDVGYESKINTVYMCGKGATGDDAAGANALKDKVGEVLGFEIQYYAHVNYKVLSEVVDAIGGIEVTIESDDPRGIYDPNFDWQCNHQCRLVDYKNGEVAQLDGQHALALARARNAQGGYGLPSGNFDRERNQQKIIKAIQQKAVSAGTLADLGKVTSLIEALGENLRSNFETKEVRTLVDLASEIGGDKLKSVPLDEEGSAVVTTGNYYGQSVVMPVEGVHDYSGIQRYLANKIIVGGAALENKTVSVYNASGTPGLAQEYANKVEKKGITVISVDNAPEDYTGKNYFYGNIDGGQETKKALERMGMQYKSMESAMTGIVDSGSDINIIIGSSGSNSNPR